MNSGPEGAGGQQRTHGWVRPFAVPDSLAELRGPTSGVVRLPLSVYSSGGGRAFDLAEEAQRIEMYEVLLTNGTVHDQAGYLDAGELRRLWRRLWLPAAVRGAWEVLLASAGAGQLAGGVAGEVR